jgi:hypothetical protein
VSAYGQIQSGIASAIGNVNLPGAFSASLQPNPANTSTAVNLAIVVNGQLQGLIKSLSVDEQFNQQRVRAIGGAVAVAIIPGVYEATASFNKSFIFGQTLETAFGGGIRPVVGQYQANVDFTQFYFNIVELDAQSNALAVYHDCVLMSLRRAVDIDGVIIMEDAQIGIRWSE